MFFFSPKRWYLSTRTHAVTLRETVLFTTVNTAAHNTTLPSAKQNLSTQAVL